VKVPATRAWSPECEAARKRKSDEVGASLSGRTIEPGSRAMMDVALGYAQCIASDDPRRKEK